MQSRSPEAKSPTQSPLSPRGGSIFCGFLNKQNPHGLKYSTKKRWFVLDGNKLYYYIQPEDPKPKGFIDLTTVQRLNTKSGNCFILSTPKREWVLFANSRAEVISWLKCIKSTLESISVSKNVIPQPPPLPPAPIITLTTPVPRNLTRLDSGTPPPSPPRHKNSLPAITPLGKIPQNSVVNQSAPKLGRPQTPLRAQVTLAPPVNSPTTPSPTQPRNKSPTPNLQKKIFPHLGQLPRTSSASAQTRSKVIELERAEIHLEKLKNQKSVKEKEEMKILLKALCSFERPFAGADKQATLEADIHKLEEQIINTTATVTNYQKDIQQNINGNLNWGVLRERKR